MPADPFQFQLPSHEREGRLDDLRLAWRDACSDVRIAYLSWREASPARAAAAFAAYVAAADREATAADRLAEHVAVTP